MDPGLGRADRRPGQRIDAGKAGVAPGKQRLRLRALRLVEPGQSLAQRLERRLGLAAHRALPGLEIGGADRLGGEGGIVGRGRQRPVQLRGALSQDARLLQVEAVRLGLCRGGLRMLGRGAQAQLVERAVQVLGRVDPAVALVAHEAEHRGERGGLAVGAGPLDRAEQRRGVGEARLLDQEAADLDLRLHARRELAIGLEDRAVADHRGRVALLDRRALDLDLLGQGELLGGRGRPAAQAAVGARQLEAAPDRIERDERELRARHRVVERADPGATAHLGERERQERPAVAQRLVVVAGGERQEVALRLGIACQLDPKLGQKIAVAPVGAELAPGRDRDVRDALVLGAEPALLGEERRQHLALELARVLALEQGAPALAHHERDEVGHRFGHRFMPARQLRFFGEHEPEEAVAG